MQRRLPALALVLLMFTFLVSCGTDDDGEKKSGGATKPEERVLEHAKNKIATVDPICPQVAIVHGLDVVQDFASESPDASHLVSAAKLLGVEGDCEYRDDGIDIAFRLNMVAKRGPRLGGLHANYPLFVAVVSPAGEVLNKNQLTEEISFSSNEPTSFHNEALHVFIPLAKSDRQTGPSFKVLSGFQLSPERTDTLKAKNEGKALTN